MFYSLLSSLLCVYESISNGIIYNHYWQVAVLLCYSLFGGNGKFWVEIFFIKLINYFCSVFKAELHFTFDPQSASLIHPFSLLFDLEVLILWVKKWWLGWNDGIKFKLLLQVVSSEYVGCTSWNNKWMAGHHFVIIGRVQAVSELIKI